MGIILSDNIQTNASKPTDSRYYNNLTPYSSVSAANIAIGSGVRYTGLTINILGVEYWYGTGIADSCLVIKSASGVGTITGATNLGSGNGNIYTSVSDNKINLKTLSGGTNVTLTCNGNYIAINSNDTSGIEWNGTTANGIGTYIDVDTICSQPNLIFNGTRLGITGNVCASTCVTSPIISGTTCVTTPISIGTTCVCSPIILASTHVCSPIITGSTRMCSLIICGTTCVASLVLYGSTCSNSPLHCGACVLATSYVCSPIISGSTCICSPIVCATTCFVGSGAGLTGTASSLTVGTAINANCLGGQLPTYYAIKADAITGATNLGSGNGIIYTSVNVNKVQLKTLSGGTNVTLTCNGNYIGINSSGNASLSEITITGNSTTTGFTINHAKNKFVAVEIIRNISPYPTIYTGVSRPNANCVCITFDTAPTTGLEYKILIIS